MDFTEYQRNVVSLSHQADFGNELVPLLGIGAHSGALLHAHQRYLWDVLDARVSRNLISQEIGLCIRNCALLASVHSLDLAEVARENLAKVFERGRTIGISGLPTSLPEGKLSVGQFGGYSELTDQQVPDGLDPYSLSVPLLGLAGEAGSLLLAMKKRYRGDPNQPTWPEFVAEEIGDLLWYAAAVARHAGLTLDDALADDLRLLETYRRRSSEEIDLSNLPVLDEQFPDKERFPRRMTLRFQQREIDGHPVVRMVLLDAQPNAFVDGPDMVGEEKVRGFRVGDQLGAVVNDNSSAADNYRFHDAIHFGFLAVMGWSPNLRSLLKLKRRSDPAVDENEDGARAIFAEEGMAAIVAKRADSQQRFAHERFVDDSTLEILTTVLEDLEVAALPPWLWRRALQQGFSVMDQLAEAGGGFVVADLDRRTLTYHKVPPRAMNGT